MRTSLSDIGRPVVVSVALIGLMLIGADGQVSLQASYYNSEGSLSEEIMVENAGYRGVSVLLPTDSQEGLPSISSDGAGQSNGGRSSEFSYSATSTTPKSSEKVSAAVEVQSGGYNWGKSAQISSDGSFAKMNVAGGTNGGSVDVSFRNSDFSLDKEANCKNSRYFFATSINPDSIISYGKGLEELPQMPRGRPDIDFSLALEAEGLGKRVLMDTDAEEQTMAIRNADLTWIDRTQLSATGGSMTSTLNFEALEGWTFVKSFIARPVPPVPVERPPGVPGPDMNLGPITAGMMFQAKDTTGQNDLSETRYVPESGKLSLSMRPSRDVSEILSLSMSAKWDP